MNINLYIKKRCFILMLSLTLTSCGTQLSDYDNTQPHFELAEYFNGPITAWGLVQDYNNQVVRRFCVEMEGIWQPINAKKQQKGLLKEVFYFDDGEVSYRNWQLTREAQQYFGRAEDVIGEASGRSSGFSFQWQYVLSLNIDDREYHFSLDDWLYQVDDYRIFNQTKMKKFGITVAKLTLFFDKQKPLRQCVKGTN